MSLVAQAPSPQPKKEKGRRKCGLKPKKREGKGDEFLLQNGKQVQRTSMADLLLPGSGKPEDTGCHCRDRGAVQDKGRGGQNCDRTQNHPSTKVEIRIKIPEELKSYIVDDWAQICRRKRLTILPARSLKNIIWRDHNASNPGQLLIN